MSDLRFVPTRVPHLHLVAELFPGLQSPEMRSIVLTMAEKQRRRNRMELEDQADAVRLPAPSGRIAP